jgi:hypothetical protein
MFFLTDFKICETNRTTYLQVRLHFGSWSDPCFAASDPMRAHAGVFYSIALTLIKAWFSAALVCRSLQSTSAKPRRKEIAMTDHNTEPQVFDLEDYRAYLAPLELPRETEDELLCDLWAIAEALVDQSFSDPLYPQQFAVAAGAFRALDDAIAVKSKEPAPNTTQTTTPQSTQEELVVRDFFVSL